MPARPPSAAPATSGLTLGGILRGVLIIAGVITGVIIGSVLVGLILVFTGSPEACVDRAIPVSPAAAQASRDKWDVFKAEAFAGPASVTFSETEITSRGVEYVDEKDIPLDDLQVYFCPQGYAEATGTINGPGPNIKVLIRGTLDLTGDKPRIDVMDIRAGNLPGAVARRLVNPILDRSDVKTLDISVNLTSITFVDGASTLTGGP